MNTRTLLMSLFLFSACGGADLSPLEESDAEIISGRRDARHRAVGQVGTRDGRGVGWFCSGTLIDPRLVLTAAHCLYDSRGRRLGGLVFGNEDEVLEVDFSTIDGYRPGSSGPWNDIALLHLSDAASTAPISIARVAPRAAQRVSVVGYGVTRATGPHTGVGGGTRRSATVSLSAVDERELSYVAEPRGACYGDSGGPLLFRSGGRERVVGVTSRGTQVDCQGTEIATRVDAYVDWIDRYLEDR
jgi:secreted trypsin-like serine protease